MDIYIVAFTKPPGGNAHCWAETADQAKQLAIEDARSNGYTDIETGHIEGPISQPPRAYCYFSTYIEVA